MRKYLLLVSYVLTFSCYQRANTEIVMDYKNAQMSGSSNELSNLLSDNVVAVFSDIQDTLIKKDILFNHEFHQPYQPWYEITSIREVNDSTVEIHSLETNELLSSFEIDTIGYLYRYTLSNSLISKIEMDTIANSDFDYRTVDSLYNLRLAELFDWASLVYPKKYKRIRELTAESSKLILELAREKEDNGQ